MFRQEKTVFSQQSQWQETVWTTSEPVNCNQGLLPKKIKKLNQT